MENLTINKNGSTFLNLLRVIAAQAVVVGHLISWLNIFPKLQPPFLPYMQGLGVVVFFILSGMVIPYSTAQKLNANPNYSFKEFFIERFARIYSAYFPCLLFVVIIDFIMIRIDSSSYGYYENFNLSAFFSNLFMLQDHPLKHHFGIFSAESFGSNRPLWTLSVEWWIYFWFGFLYIVLIKNKKVNPLTILVFVVFSIVPYYNLGRGRGEGLMLAWLLGCVVILLLPTLNKLKLNKYLILFFVICLAGMAVRRYLNGASFGYSESLYTIYIAVAISLLISYFNTVNFSEKIHKIINVLADFSFSVYLLHYSIISLLLLLFKDKINPYLFLIVAFFVSNIVAYYFAYFTEMKYKTLRSFLKRKLLPTN